MGEEENARYIEGQGIPKGTVYRGTRYTDVDGIPRGTVYRCPVYLGPLCRGPVYRGPVYRGITVLVYVICEDMNDTEVTSTDLYGYMQVSPQHVSSRVRFYRYFRIELEYV